MKFGNREKKGLLLPSIEDICVNNSSQTAGVEEKERLHLNGSAGTTTFELCALNPKLMVEFKRDGERGEKKDGPRG